MFNLKQIVQTACAELGLTQPTAVATAVDLQTQQLFALANNVGARELLKIHEWTFLQTQYIINIPAPISTTGTLSPLSPVITNIPSTAGISAGTFVCSGNAIPTSARVQTVNSSSQITLDSEATVSIVTNNVPLLFAQDTYPEPADFDRFIDQTMWDRTNRWPLLGPSSPQEDQWHRSGVVTVGPRRHFRQVGQYPYNWRFWPPPGTGDTPIEFVQEYISNGWVNVHGAGTTFAKAFANDDDVPLFDDRAIIDGIKYKFFQIKQFDYAPLQSDYIEHVDQLIAMDGPKGTLNLARKRFNPLITPATIQDGYFPGPTGPNMS
jgi:hypothetical protein